MRATCATYALTPLTMQNLFLEARYNPHEMKGALFLDRDGTIIEDTGYAHELKDMHIYPQAPEALKMLSARFPLFIITNQPGIEMGLYTVDEFKKFNDHMLEELGKHGVKIVETYFCPHKSGCDCRKPSTKFIAEIAHRYGVDPKLSWVVGDHPSDVQMGIRAGCRTAYLVTGHGEKHMGELNRDSIKPDIIASNLLTAARSIMRLENEDN